MKIDVKTFKLMKNIPNSGYDSLKTLLLYHSNKIEGSVFSKEELNDLFSRGIVNFSNISEEKVKTFDDITESSNSGRLFDYVIDTLGQPLTKDEICKWNGILMKNTTLDNCGFTGKYKVLNNKIANSRIEVSNIDNVYPLMDEYLHMFNDSKECDLQKVAELHSRFEHIHPFQDGNGRIGRMMMLKLCAEHNIDLVAINDGFKYKYYDALEYSQVEKYFTPLLEVFEDCQKAFDHDIANLMPLIESYKKASCSLNPFSLDNLELKQDKIKDEQPAKNEIKSGKTQEAL